MCTTVQHSYRDLGCNKVPFPGFNEFICCLQRAIPSNLKISRKALVYTLAEVLLSTSLPTWEIQNSVQSLCIRSYVIVSWLFCWAIDSFKNGVSSVPILIINWIRCS